MKAPRPRPTGLGAVGHAAYLAVNGQLLAARVVGVEGKRLRTVDHAGVARLVAPARLLWVSDQVLADEAELAPWWRDVQARSADCDLRMAWELLAEDCGLREMDVVDLASLTPGGAGALEQDALVSAVFDDGTFFKLRNGRVHPTSAEAMEAARSKAEGEARAERSMALAVEALGPVLRGSKEVPPAGEEVDAAVAEQVAALVDLAVYGRDAEQQPRAFELLTRLGYSTTRGNVVRRAFELLVRLEEFGPDENLFVRRARVRRRFPAQVLEAAESVGDVGLAGRRDHRELFTLAIDDARTTEVDDAFAIEGERLHVFIADAATFAPRGSHLDREAARRASTLYVPEGKIPMMPLSIGEGAASLEAGVDRPALCFSARLGEDGGLTDFQLEESMIRVDRRLTYVDTDKILAAGEASPGDRAAALILEGARWMARHRELRRSRGALLLQRREVDIVIAEDGAVSVLPVNANGPARQLVSEMMVAIGVATARWCHERGVPCVYRTQPPPDQPLDVGGQEVVEPSEQVRILRKLKPSALATQPGYHFTLGVEAYTQVTSPIRRYQDLVMHQQLKSVLRGGPPLLSDTDLEAVFEEVDRLAGALRRVEYASRRYWTYRYLEQHRDATFQAVALRPMGKRWVIEVGELALQAVIRPQSQLTPGQVFRVEVADVAARSDHAVLREVAPT